MLWYLCNSYFFSPQPWSRGLLLLFTRSVNIHVILFCGLKYSQFKLLRLPTRCTNVSNLFWNDNLHVSNGLSVHHQEFKTVHTATGICQTDTAVCLITYLLASRQQYLSDKCLLLYVQSWTPDDGRKDHPKHVECQVKRDKPTRCN